MTPCHDAGALPLCYSHSQCLISWLGFAIFRTINENRRFHPFKAFSDTRDPLFETGHRQNLNYQLYN